MKTKLLIVTLLFYCFLQFPRQDRIYKVRTIAFYNVENLFDTINDPLTFDDDRTPLGKDRWNSNRYHQKINNISKVLSEIGSETTKTSPDIIGLCEVENKQVIEDLTNHSFLRDKDYGIIHFDSPDERGIDVALLYKKKVFLPTSFKSHRLLLLNDEGDRDYTRDQLVVGGLFENEQLFFIVNHWPSRSGGQARSKPNRISAAKLNKRIIDSIYRLDGLAHILVMGDLNDDPIDDSLKKVLKTKGKKMTLSANELFNPMEQLHKKGHGSLAYRDKWNLFDQFYLTGNMLDTEKTQYHYWKAGIYNPSYLTTQGGKFKGYPLRTYSGGNYTSGYSDHYPVYLYLIKEVQ